MVKPFYKDEYATLELDDSIPCIKTDIGGNSRYSEHYQFVQQKRLELIQAGNRQLSQTSHAHR